ncbi:hypothetical protein BTJ68_06143 [Hortaea werneckii EXF-2000]|uniref:cutinase n=1 Tax=Hortaea werneckii EXF-2000 TaxID=1157616 RepID=A0A1Z5TB37_HORWE|nr:hypothetical protein BTJ68_06143 [Hortaea werneckii EXF-2000]
MKFSANLSYLVYAASVALAVPVEKRASTSYSGGSTATDVADGVCAPVTFIFARGSTETGNMGSTVGPALAKALISALGSDGVAIQGVEYPATIESNISMGSEGGPEMAKLAQQALSNCPDTKIALSGYSQGATVTHYAVKSGGLDAEKVSAVVLYGDPLYGQSVGDLPDSKLKEFCGDIGRWGLRNRNIQHFCCTLELYQRVRHQRRCRIHRIKHRWEQRHVLVLRTIFDRTVLELKQFN